MMKYSRLAMLAAAALFAAPVVASAGHMGSGQTSQGQYGQGQYSQGQYGSQAQQSGQMSGQQSGNQAAQPQQGSQAQSSQTNPDLLASQFTATVTGQAEKVDQQSGKLTLRTPDGPISVRFPPVALQNVKPGDQVTVAIGLLEQNSQPAASPNTNPDSSSTMPGSSSSYGNTSH